MTLKKKAHRELRELNVQPSKQRGQNFIVNPFVIESVLDFGQPLKSDALVEIGPGLGALTAALYEVACAGPHALQLIEIEKNLSADLSVRFPQAKVHCNDVRQVQFSELGSELVVFGNLPYSLSTDILFHVLRQRGAIRRAVFMLQREFAERVASPPGSRTYGSLSVAIQLWCDVVLGPVVPGDAFHPPTKVESIVIQLTPRKEAAAGVTDFALFERVVRASFSKRRRTIMNSLKGSALFDAELLAKAFVELGLDPERRAESMTIDEFAGLTRCLGAPV